MAEISSLPPDPAAGTSFRSTAAPSVVSEIREEGTFASLVGSLRDTFFPAKLPPLVLESTPIAVPDRMKTKMSPTSIAASVAFYALLLLLIGFLIRQHVTLTAPAKQTVVTNLEAPPPPPPIKPMLEKMGGGGGQQGPTPVTQGHLPKFAKDQIVPPKAPPLDKPKLAVEPTVVMQDNLKMADNKMPDLGAPNSNLKGFSMGNGNGSGLGSGNGNGVGPGTGGNTGGGAFHIGGGVRPPALLSSVEAEFSEEARKAKFSGNVLVSCWVDEHGVPTHVRVTRGVGMGLDEKAVEAVRQYRFKPATLNGKPVTIDNMNIEVNFQIF